MSKILPEQIQAGGSLTTGWIMTWDGSKWVGQAPAGGNTNIVTLGGTSIYTTTAPATPAQGATLYVGERANRQFPMYVSVTGRTERFQTYIGTNNIYMHQANANATTYSTWGSPLTAVTAATAIPVSNVNFLTMQRRNQQNIATATGIVEQWGQHLTALGPVFGQGGFHFIMRFGITNFGATAKLFCGLHGVAGAQTNIEPFNFTAPYLGMVKNSADSTLRMIITGGSGSPAYTTLTNTGSMTSIANSFWQVELFYPKTGTVIGYRVTRWNSDGTELIDNGTLTTTAAQGNAGGLPAANAVLAPRLWMANTAAVTLTMQFSQFFMEVD